MYEFYEILFPFHTHFTTLLSSFRKKSVPLTSERNICQEKNKENEVLNFRF